MTRQRIGGVKPSNGAFAPDVKLRDDLGGIVERHHREVDAIGLITHMHNQRRAAILTMPALANVA